jgi:hypothetical protein
VDRPGEDDVIAGLGAARMTPFRRAVVALGLGGLMVFSQFATAGVALGATAQTAASSDLAVPQSGTTRSGAYVAGWEATIDHDVYYLATFTSPFDQPWEPQHEVAFAHDQGSAVFMYLEIPRSIETIANGDHDVEITAWFERWCETAWVNRDVVAPMAEMNGDWTIWSGVGRADTYKAAFQRVQSLAPCHVRWAYAPSDHRGWDRYFPGDEAGYIVFIAPSVFAWSCGTSPEAVIRRAVAMRDHFNKPTILAQTGTACSTDRAEWFASLFAEAGRNGVFGVIPGHYPEGGQPLEPWDNEGFAWALRFTENQATLRRQAAVDVKPEPVLRQPRMVRLLIWFR